MTRWLAISGALFVGFLVLGWATVPAPTAVDLQAARLGELMTVAGVGPLLELLNCIGELPVWIGVVACICIGFAIRRRWEIVALLLSGEPSEAVVAIAKTTFGRARPALSAENPFGGLVDGSYPSGHVTRVVMTLGVLAMYGVPSRWRTRAIMASATFIALMALARVAAQDHWLTDALGGVFLGAAWLALLAAVAPLLGRLQTRSPHSASSPTVETSEDEQGKILG